MTAANWNNPTNATDWEDVLAELKLTIEHAVTHDFSLDTNIPTNARQYNDSTDTFQKWNGSSWVSLDFHALIAYLAENETITGAWTFDALTTFDTTQHNDVATFGADIVMTLTDSIIRSNTSNGSDTKAITLCGGGGASSSQGAYIKLYGNEHTGGRPGFLDLYAGNESGAEINFFTSATLTLKILRTQSGGHTVSEYGMRQKAGASSNYSAMDGLFISDTLGNNGNTAGSSGVSIKSVSVPANTLNSNGEQLRVFAMGAFSSSGSTNKRLRLRWAGVDIYDTGGLTIVSQQWWFEARIIRSSSTNAACFLRYTNSNGFITVTSVNITTTFSNANTLAVLGGGTLADDVTAYMLQADYIPGSPN
jgi:hypothetical protein